MSDLNQEIRLEEIILRAQRGDSLEDYSVDELKAALDLQKMREGWTETDVFGLPETPAYQISAHIEKAIEKASQEKG
jgi:hypothetical protein